MSKFKISSALSSGPNKSDKFFNKSESTQQIVTRDYLSYLFQKRENLYFKDHSIELFSNTFWSPQDINILGSKMSGIQQTLSIVMILFSDTRGQQSSCKILLRKDGGFDGIIFVKVITFSNLRQMQFCIIHLCCCYTIILSSNERIKDVIMAKR